MRRDLYHHFEDKRALFRAVVQAELAAVAQEIERSTDAGVSPFEALIAGTDAFFRAMTVAGRTRLLLIDAPAVVGWDELYELDTRHGTRTLRDALSAAMDAGTIPTLPIEAMTTLMSAIFDRSALAIESGGRAADCRAVVVAIFEGLRRLAHESDGKRRARSRRRR